MLLRRPFSALALLLLAAAAARAPAGGCSASGTARPRIPRRSPVATTRSSPIRTSRLSPSTGAPC